MKGLVNEGDCPACGKTVRYCGYVPRIYLCADCGGEEPHAEGVVERDGRLYYEPDQELVTDGGEGLEAGVCRCQHCNDSVDRWTVGHSGACPECDGRIELFTSHD